MGGKKGFHEIGRSPIDSLGIAFALLMNLLRVMANWEDPKDETTKNSTRRPVEAVVSHRNAYSSVLQVE